MDLESGHRQGSRVIKHCSGRQHCQQDWPHLHDPCGQHVTLPSPSCHHLLCFLDAGAQLNRKGPRCSSNEAPHVSAADCTVADQAILKQPGGWQRRCICWPRCRACAAITRRPSGAKRNLQAISFTGLAADVSSSPGAAAASAGQEDQADAADHCHAPACRPPGCPRH